MSDIKSAVIVSICSVRDISSTMTLIGVKFWMMVDMGPGHKVFPLGIPNFVTTITRHNYQQKADIRTINCNILEPIEDRYIVTVDD